MISWWSLRKPMHSANMMPDLAPLREPNRSVLSPRHLCPQVLPVPQTQTLHWTSTPWTSFLRQISGPDTGSLHCPLDIPQATVCATSVGFGNASLRLLSWKPVRAVPGPKSGPRFFMPSWENSCQARGVRVVGYLASGPTGAALLVLRQQVLITAKLRGRHSFFLFGVIAASPCCTWYTGRLAEVRPPHRSSTPLELHLLSPKASTSSFCQLACVLSRWPWHAASLALAPVSACCYKQWLLGTPATTTPLLRQSAGCSVPAQELGICMPGVCSFGLLPQSAPSGSRLSFASIYSQELHITPEQGPSRRLWLSRWALRKWPPSLALTMQLHAYMGGAARFMSPSRAVRRSSHLLHSASAHFGIITFTLPGIPGTRHHPWKHTQPCQILLRYPGADYLHLPRPYPPLILLGISFLLPWVVRTIGRMALGAEPVESWQPGPRRKRSARPKQRQQRRPPPGRPSRTLEPMTCTWKNQHVMRRSW